MQRKKSNNRNGRLANADEKRFHGWVKEQCCSECGVDGPSIVDHCKGATFGHNKVHVGHWFVLPKCVACDTEKTILGKRNINESEEWIKLNNEYELEPKSDAFHLCSTPKEVIDAIGDWNK